MALVLARLVPLALLALLVLLALQAQAQAQVLALALAMGQAHPVGQALALALGRAMGRARPLGQAMGQALSKAQGKAQELVRELPKGFLREQEADWGRLVHTRVAPKVRTLGLRGQQVQGLAMVPAQDAATDFPNNYRCPS